MTINEDRQRLKNEALNQIRQLYHPLFKFSYDSYSDESYTEQRESYIRYLIEDLENSLKNVKNR